MWAFGFNSTASRGAVHYTARGEVVAGAGSTGVVTNQVGLFDNKIGVRAACFGYVVRWIHNTYNGHRTNRSVQHGASPTRRLCLLHVGNIQYPCA